MQDLFLNITKRIISTGRTSYENVTQQPDNTIQIGDTNYCRAILKCPYYLGENVRK